MIFNFHHSQDPDNKFSIKIKKLFENCALPDTYSLVTFYSAYKSYNFSCYYGNFALCSRNTSHNPDDDLNTLKEFALAHYWRNGKQGLTIYFEGSTRNILRFENIVNSRNGPEYNGFKLVVDKKGDTITLMRGDIVVHSIHPISIDDIGKYIDNQLDGKQDCYYNEEVFTVVKDRDTFSTTFNKVNLSSNDLSSFISLIRGGHTVVSDGWRDALTSFFPVKVVEYKGLEISSINGLYIVKYNGEEYRDRDLNSLFLKLK